MIKGNLLKKENKIVVLTVALLGLFIIIGTSFAMWNLTFRQTSTNQINTSCFKIEFTEKDDINLSDAYPLTGEEASNLSPYTFKITNICDTSSTYQVNLEELEIEGKKLSNQYINLSLNEKTGRLSTFEEVTKTLDNATMSHKLTTGVLKSKEEKSFELRLWLRDDAPSNEEIMNASFLSKITVVTVYKKNIPEVNSLAYENQGTIKVDVNTIANPDNETLNYYYQLDNNEEVKSNTGTHTFPNLQDGTYKIKVRVEDTNGIVLFEKEENVVVAYEHVYISSTGNDTTGNGSPASPYATLQRAYNKVKSGGEMILLSDITATSTTSMNTANKEVTLKSNGENIYSVTKDSTLTSGILNIDNSNTITTTEITFDGNNVNSTNSLIESRNSTLNLNKGTIVKNNIEVGNGARGGGLYVLDSTLNINGATISDNRIQGTNKYSSLGGGLLASRSTVNFNSGNILRNKTNWHGGGIAIVNATLYMNGGTVSSNNAAGAGGILVYSGTMTMTGGTISNNAASEQAGGIYTSKGPAAGETSVAYIRGGTITNNTAPTGPNTYAIDGTQIIYQ